MFKAILGTAGAIAGYTIGGIGIAAMGTAFGIPALATAAIMGTAGTVVGSKIDEATE